MLRLFFNFFRYPNFWNTYYVSQLVDLQVLSFEPHFYHSVIQSLSNIRMDGCFTKVITLITNYILAAWT